MPNGHVYVVRAESGGPCKIGFTVHLPRRLSSLRSASSEGLKVIRSLAGSRETEAWFHKRFAARRLSREWFEFDPDMLTVTPPAPSPGSGALDAFVAEQHGLVSSEWQTEFVAALNRATDVRRLVIDVGCDKRVAANYMRGTHYPPMHILLRMMAVYPEVANSIIRTVKLAHYERTLRALEALEIAKRELGAGLLATDLVVTTQ